MSKCEDAQLVADALARIGTIVDALAERLAKVEAQTKRFEHLVDWATATDTNVAKIVARLDADPWRNNQTAPLLTRDDVDQMRTPPPPEPPVRQASAETIEAVASMTRKWPVKAPTAVQPEAPAGFKVHHLKTWPEFFDDVVSGRKTFEIRKNDRDFKVGDEVILEEFDEVHGYTGSRCYPLTIAYVTPPSRCLPDGVVGFGFEKSRRIELPAEPSSDAGTVAIDGYLCKKDDEGWWRWGIHGSRYCWVKWEGPNAPSEPAKQESPRRASQLSTSACGRTIASGVKCGDGDRRCTDCLPELATALASAEGRPLCPSSDCLMCSGEACDKCGAGCWNNDPKRPRCEHDVLERHEKPREAAKDSPAPLIPPGYRLADGWEALGPSTAEQRGKCSIRWHDRDARYASRRAMESACDDECAIRLGALVPVEPAQKPPALLTRNDVNQMRTPPAPQPEASAGLYRKFVVERTDGSSRAGGKHEQCDYFVLDWVHDKYAVPAMQAYAKACQAEYPALAEDIRVRCLATAFANTPPRTEPLPAEPCECLSVLQRADFSSLEGTTLVCNDCGKEWVHVVADSSDVPGEHRWTEKLPAEPPSDTGQCCCCDERGSDVYRTSDGRMYCEACRCKRCGGAPPDGNTCLCDHVAKPAPSEPAKAPLSEGRFDVCAWAKENDLFHCSAPNEVLGICHDYRCDELRKIVADLEARLEQAEKERDELKRDFDEMNLQRHEALDGVIRAELAERARVNGWWRTWLSNKRPFILASERDECIASGAPVPGGAT